MAKAEDALRQPCRRVFLTMVLGGLVSVLRSADGHGLGRMATTNMGIWLTTQCFGAGGIWRALAVAFTIGLLDGAFGWHAVAMARGRTTIEVGLSPYYGWSRVQSPAIDAMNERLGNSPRLSQPLKFGNQSVYGANLHIWTARKRYLFGLGGLTSTQALAGASGFDDVVGKAELSLSAGTLEGGMRLFPWREARQGRRMPWWTRIRGFGTITAGYGNLSFRNVILDPEREIDVRYGYSDDRWLAGARLLVTYQVTDWLYVTLLDGRMATWQPIGGAVDVVGYIVSGRDESPLATQALLEDFENPIFQSMIVWGVEVFF